MTVTIPPCKRCGEPHIGRSPKGQMFPSCNGHTGKGVGCKRARAKGQKVCRTHGGSAPQALAKAEEVLSEKAAEKLAHKWGVPIETTPIDAILGRISAYAGHVRFYERKVNELIDTDDRDLAWGMTREKFGGDDAGTTYEAKPNIWLNLYNDASDRLVKYCAEAIRANIDERQIRLAEQEGDLIVDVLTGTADAILEALTAAGMPEKFVEIFEATMADAAPRHLRLLYGGAA